MRATPMTLVLILALSGVGQVALGKETSVPPGAGDSRFAETDAVIRAEMEERRIPGLSLAIVQGGHLVVAKGYGLANVELDVSATAETVYQIQSITKSFTATAIMMLAEEGRLSVDDRIDKYFGVGNPISDLVGELLGPDNSRGDTLPQVPESWKGITLRHLLTHTSGLKDFINEPTANLRLDVTDQQVLRVASTRPLNFPPGQQYRYSNTNYHLLAMVIRKVTGKSYGDFLRERIFDPLGMEHTRVISLSEIIPHRAAGYLLRNGSLCNGEFIAPSVLAYGGGGLRSTVLDMAKWDAALYSDRLLKQSALQQMWTPARLSDGTGAPYGFGWGIEQIDGHRCVAHNGAHVTGFTSAIRRFVDDKLTVIVLTNCNHGNPDRIALRVAKFYLPGFGSGK